MSAWWDLIRTKPVVSDTVADGRVVKVNVNANDKKYLNFVDDGRSEYWLHYLWKVLEE